MKRRDAAVYEAAREARAEIIRRYRASEPVRRIAATYDVSESWVRDRLDEWGVPRRQHHEALKHVRPMSYVYRGRSERRTSEEVQQAQDKFTKCRDTVVIRYRKGESVASLAREFAVQPRWARAQMDKWGVPRRDQSAAASLANRTRVRDLGRGWQR
ncbi:helix-turn-helix domain-containing protein [Streptomyces sp. NPDC091383]|uniref:helix-turn-helix domain-containing protein n=1 Tax=Streptomyces sp. NPDC091383 TaxID=3365996 RepID=UPI00380982CC